ncbi:MAG: anti-sigma factor, partial [Pseudomonadota bacterium]
RMVIEQPQSGMLMVKMVKPWKAAKDNSLQLWVIPKDGAPRSIGIINQDGSTQIAMKEMDAMLNNGLEFAVSKEPMGGSPTGQPTGKIICKGVIAKMPPKQKDKSQI